MQRMDDSNCYSSLQSVSQNIGLTVVVFCEHDMENFTQTLFGLRAFLGWDVARETSTAILLRREWKEILKITIW